MDKGVSDLTELLRSMQPLLHEGVYVYCVVPHGASLAGLNPIATMQEAEGLTLVLPEQQAVQLGMPVRFRAAWITLAVHSDLRAVGLTAAFASALGRAGISCNVMAGAYHDHIFVPVELAQQALAALVELQRQAAR